MLHDDVNFFFGAPFNLLGLERMGAGYLRYWEGKPRRFASVGDRCGDQETPVADSLTFRAKDLPRSAPYAETKLLLWQTFRALSSVCPCPCKRIIGPTIRSIRPKNQVCQFEFVMQDISKHVLPFDDNGDNGRSSCSFCDWCSTIPPQEQASNH